MFVHRLCSAAFANDLSGEGSRLHGGRWTPKGYPVIYTSSNPSLSVLELYVHVKHMMPPKFKLIKIEIDDEAVSKTTLAIKQLPENWRSYPEPPSLHAIGKNWLDSGHTLILEVPSAVVPFEVNYIINVRHASFANSVKISDSVDFPMDKRLIP